VTPLLALLPRDVDWGNSLWFIAFVVVPLLARFFKWLFVRLGLLRAGETEEDPDARRERLRRAREEQRRTESEGEDLWRKLARGEVGESPSAAPVPPPVLARATSLESEEEPEPLAMLGESREPSEAPEESLEREEEPVPLAALAEPVALAPVQFEETPRAPRVRGFRLARGDLRRAIVLNEILGAPVSERSLRA
jgi:hypothetical protein